MKNLKEIGQEHKSKKYEIEGLIDAGIELYNSKNNEEIPLISKYSYGVKNLTYSFDDEGILLSWEKELSSCGGYTDYEDKEKTIPYSYFKENKNNDILEVIDEDKRKRDNLKEELNLLINENATMGKELKEHRKHLFAAKDIEKIYKTYFSMKDIEREMKKCEAIIFLNNEKIKDLNKELK